MRLLDDQHDRKVRGGSSGLDRSDQTHQADFRSTFGSAGVGIFINLSNSLFS